MKNLLKIVSIIGLTTMAQTAYTAEITDTYNTGDTLTATTLETIKNAVNDNNARIDTVAPPPGPAGAQGPTGADSVTGNTFGDMQVWDGTAWVLIPVPVGPSEASLHLCGGLPTYDVCIYAIGDTGPAGGIVFHITDAGAHGLEAAFTYNKSNTRHSACPFTTVVGSSATAVGAGSLNTIDLIAGCGAEMPGIRVASRDVYDFSLNGFDDWFLPTRDELLLLTSVPSFVQTLASRYVWSSSQIAPDRAWGADFGSDFSFDPALPVEIFKYENNLAATLPVRAF